MAPESAKVASKKLQTAALGMGYFVELMTEVVVVKTKVEVAPEVDKLMAEGVEEEVVAPVESVGKSAVVERWSKVVERLDQRVEIAKLAMMFRGNLA